MPSQCRGDDQDDDLGIGRQRFQDWPRTERVRLQIGSGRLHAALEFVAQVTTMSCSISFSLACAVLSRLDSSSRWRV